MTPRCLAIYLSGTLRASCSLDWSSLFRWLALGAFCFGGQPCSGLMESTSSFGCSQQIGRADFLLGLESAGTQPFTESDTLPGQMTDLFPGTIVKAHCFSLCVYSTETLSVCSLVSLSWMLEHFTQSHDFSFFM